MTKLQIDYWGLQNDKSRLDETKRSNRQNERETNRHNQATEHIDLSKLAETSRHNKAAETLDLSKLNETQRSNKANENLKFYDLSQTHEENRSKISETNRSNRAQEDLEWTKQQETKRSNKANESNASRSNDIREQFNDIQDRYNTGRLDDADAEREIKTMLAQIEGYYKAGQLNNQQMQAIASMVSALSRSSSNFTRIFDGISGQSTYDQIDWYNYLTGGNHE